MPLKRCELNGKSGWKWGEEGTCYTQSNGKELAIRQAIAISKSIGEGIELQETYNDYPKGARDNAKRALDWIDKYGRDMVKAGTRVGLTRANQIANGENLSVDTIRRIKAFFDRHINNRTISPEFKGTPWKDNGYTSWLLWGGDDMYRWVEMIIKRIDKE